MTHVISMYVFVVLISSTALAAAPKYDDLDQCYSRLKIDSVTTKEQDVKKTTSTVKTQADVTKECNANVLKLAKTETSKDSLVELATVIGRNADWPEAIPVFKIGAKLHKSICHEDNLFYAVEVAFQPPRAEHWAAEANELLNLCWPEAKDDLAGRVKYTSNIESNRGICKFIRSKKARAPETCPSKG